METIIMSALYMLLWFFASLIASTMGEFTRKDFFDNLFSNYEPMFHPKENLLAPVDVDVRYRLIGINTLSDTQQYMESSAKLVIRWYDIFLTWNASEMGAPEYVSVSPKQIWMPSISLYNAFHKERLLEIGNKVIITADGYVAWTTYSVFKTSCKIDITKFPFDEQFCTIIISPTYKTYSNYRLIANVTFEFLSLYQQSNEWAMLNITIGKESYSGTSNQSGSFPKVNVVVGVLLKRRYVFHIIKGVVPPVSLSILNCFVFQLPAASGERLTMAISVLLSYTIYMSLINESLPDNSDSICIFSVYLTCMLLLSVTIVLATIKGISLHHNEMSFMNSCGEATTHTETKDEQISHRPNASKSRDKFAFIVALGINCIITLVCFTIMLY